MLLEFTLLINFLGLIAALWLGLYIVTHSPRRLITWLTGLTLWSVAGLFLNILLALAPPPVPTHFPGWLRWLLPFWPSGTLEQLSASGWLQGWIVTPAVVFWHHVTLLMRPGRLTPWRWIRLLIGYGVAAAVILFQANTTLVFASASGDPLYLNTLKAGSFYPFYIAYLLFYALMSLANLQRSTWAAPTLMLRQQFTWLIGATLIGGLSIVLSIAGSALGWPIPIVALSLPLGVAVVLVGSGVTRYSALVEGRTVVRDFVYNAVAIALVTGLYMVVTWGFTQIYEIPAVVFVIVVMLAVITHSLVDIARRAIDALFYRRETRQLRANLRQLTALAGEQEGLGEQLTPVFDTLCNSVEATFGLMILFENDRLRLLATYRWHRDDLSLSPADLAADDALILQPGHFPAPLVEVVLLIPLYAETEQLGALLLGRPVNGIQYSETDLELLLYLSDQLADAICDARREFQRLAEVAHLIEAGQRKTQHLAQLVRQIEVEQVKHAGRPGHISAKVVGDALRHLADYAYLGKHSLAQLKLVRSRLPAGATTTHLDRGKVVHTVLAEAIEKLRPDGQQPVEPPPRAWHPYLILHQAYLEDKLNRDIMGRLYVSEGTFNRTRRAALGAVARALKEMEAALN